MPPKDQTPITKQASCAHQLGHLVKQLLQVLVADLVGYRGDQRLALVGAVAAEGA